MTDFASPSRDRQGAGLTSSHPATHAPATSHLSSDADNSPVPLPDGRGSDRTCGLVVYLTHNAPLARTAHDEIAANPAITLGNPAPHALPVVLESGDASSERDTIRWIESLPGVRLVTVAYAHFGSE